MTFFASHFIKNISVIGGHFQFIPPINFYIAILTIIPVTRISPPSIKYFHSSYVRANRPIVITGLIDQWPALKLWNMEYFAQNFGEVEASFIPIKGGINTYQ